MVLPLVALATSLIVALAGAACRCRTLRRALTRERAAARISRGALARDVLALEQIVARAAAERAVLAAAAEVVDAAALQHQISSDTKHRWKGGGDA